MLHYQLLKAEKNELRLLYFLQDCNSLASSATPEYPQGLVELEMKTVSLDAYTEESREFMANSGSLSYSIRDYLASRLPQIEPFASDEDRAAGIRIIEESLVEILSRPTFGRWESGDYETLSYVWGTTKASRPIIVNGTMIEVMENLEDFLREYVMNLASRPKSADRSGCWVDAICINQNDIEERNAQVKRMGDIYRNSTGATAWLGKESDESDKAMDLLISLSTHQINTNEEALAVLEAKMKSEPPKSGSWKALEYLLCRPYWSRLWVIQEIALSGNSLNFMCGNRGINWPFLHQVINALSLGIQAIERAILLDYEKTRSARPSDFAFAAGINRIQQFGVFRNAATTSFGRPELKHILSIFQAAEQIDPRDKVYGTLSLIDPDISVMITPDYSKPTSEIFTDFTQCVINSSKRLDIVARWGKPKDEQRTLPSWVSDLTQKPVVSLELTTKDYLADSASEAIFKFDNGPCYGDFEPYKYEKSVVQPICRTTPYQNEDEVMDAFWRPLVANRNEADEEAPESWKELLNISWNNDLGKIQESDDLFLWYFDTIRILNSELELNGQKFKSYFPPAGDSSQTHTLWTTFRNSIRRFQKVLGHRSIAMGDSNRNLSMQECTRRVRLLLGRKFIVTGKGYFGLAAMPAQRGDIICILLGCSIPIILRPSKDKLSYEVVGESYIHGVMDGEAMKWLEDGKFSVKDFTIS